MTEANPQPDPNPGPSSGLTTTLAINEGSVSTFAGSGTATNTNGTGTSASFNSPRGEAIIGNTLYVLDADAIRAVSLSNGAVTTLAGPASSGGGAYTDSSNPAQVTFDNPSSLTTDGVYLYFVDNGSIRRTDPTTGATSTAFAANYCAPGIFLAVTVGADGNLYTTLTDQCNDSQAVAQLNPTTGAWLYDDLGLSGAFQITANATGVYFRASDSIYEFAYSSNSYPPISTLVTSSSLWDSTDGLTAAGNYLYAVTNSGSAIVRFNAGAGAAKGTAGLPGYLGYGDGLGTAAFFNTPQALVSDGQGTLYVADMNNNMIRSVQDQYFSPGPTGGPIDSSSANETWGGENAAEPGVGSTSDGNPVNPASGDYTKTFTDATVVTDGPSLDITRTYDSNLAQYQSEHNLSGPLGTGWVDDFSTNVYVAASGNVTVTEDNGAQVFFVPESGTSCPASYPDYQLPALGGTYCALPRVTASLSLDGNSYVFTLPDGTVYQYNASGSLHTVTDPNGNSVTATYGGSGSSSCPTTPVSYETLTSSAPGRYLVIGWSGSDETGTVVSVTDPMNRQWCYGYDTAGNLSSVTDPMGKLTTYSYDESNSNQDYVHDLVSITRPDGQPGGPHAGAHLEIVYDSSGRVTSLVDPMGFTSTYDYSTMDWNSGSGSVIYTDPDGVETEYLYTNGELFSETTNSTSSSAASPDISQYKATTIQPTTSIDADNDTSQESYDPNGDMTSQTDPDGDTTNITYGPDSEAAMVSEPGGGSVTPPAAVSPGGQIQPPASIPPEGVSVTQYDTNGNALWTTTGVYAPGTTTNPYAKTTYSLYKDNTLSLNGTNISCQATPPTTSLACATVNANGVVTQLAYDSDGDLISSSVPDGNGSELATTTYAYDADGEQISEIAPDGNLLGANADNYTTVTAYNADGQVTSTTEAGGTAGSGPSVVPRTTYNYYDADGNLTSVKDARGYTTTNTYNADDEKTLVTDPDGNARLTCYDGDGHVSITVPPTGVAAESLTPASCPTSYPASYGDLLRTTDATTYTYDANGNKTAMTTPGPAGQTGPETTTYVYDPAGKLIETIAPPTSNAVGAPNDITVDNFDADGQLLSQTTGYGTSAAATTSYCYDQNGNETSVVAPDGNTGAVVSISTNPNKVTVTGLAACETSYPWVVSPTTYPTQASYQTIYSYDSANELYSMTLPATAAAPTGIKTTYGYDAQGNKTQSTDSNGVITSYSYTPTNLISEVSYSNSSAPTVNYSYDADGNKVSMSDATGTSTYSYDPFSELTSAENGAGQTVGYGYNADGEVTAITYPLPASASWATSDTVTYGYDNADRLTSVTDFNGNTISLSNTADGLPYSEALGNSGDTITATYDPTDSPSAIELESGSTALLGFSYADAPSGAILTETDTPSSSQTPANYSYDAAGRVTSMTPGSGSALNYGFDASGNLTTLPNGATGNYDNASELTSSVLSGTRTSYSYDADGEQLSAAQGSTNVASGTWNGAGELASYSDSTANMTSASYDGNGLRASDTCTPTGGSPVSAGFVWNTTSSVPELLMDSNNAYIFAGSGTPAEQVTLSSGTITYLVADSLGSVRGVVSSSGGLMASTDYDAWGNPETSGGLSNYTPFGFAGAYTDPTGIIYLIGRYYDSGTGQFLSVDPKVQDTLEAYLYVDDDPVNGIDPSGLGANPEECGTYGSIGYFACMTAVRAAEQKGRGNLFGWIGGALRDVENAAEDVERFVARHRALIETIAVTAVGLAAAGTGVGALVELGMGEEVAAAVYQSASTALSIAGGVANGAKCFAAQDKNACVGMALDLGSGLFGFTGNLVEKAGAEVLGKMLIAKGFSIGFGGLTWDTSTGRW